ncbi:MAG: GGDEF domain-containing protein [Pseudolabrys sp.]|nr:GGDEF domain-containing protein [Pseudolabrys sp.]MDP2298741.1 GGDEF domain-containing protein [Pseudolabrys sp.]
MSEFTNVLLLAGDAVLYFVALAALLRARGRIGLGAFFCALGVMHFLETYLASILYVALPLGIVTSPGSTVLFTGKLMLLLLLYIREDAVVVRQPIYGLLIGNVLLFALAYVMRHHTLIPLGAERAADFGFLDQMGGLMVWGTAILFFDCILIILLYERSRAWFGDHVFPRLLVSGALVLTFDQVAFFFGLNMLTGAGLPVLIGGWVAKMGAVALYGVLATVYLKYFERPLGRRAAPRIWDVFDTLTYRERYEDLLARTGCDALTGALDRHSLESYGRRAVENAAAAGRPLALLLIDIDHFKAFNDRFGHAAGDIMLKRITAEIMTAARVSDFTYRFGGEEFVVLADGIAGDDANALGERIRRAIAALPGGDPAGRVTASIGVASCANDASGYDRLFEIADKRLYEAKALGRNRVIGARPPTGESPVRLVKN